MRKTDRSVGGFASCGAGAIGSQLPDLAISATKLGLEGPANAVPDPSFEARPRAGDMARRGAKLRPGAVICVRESQVRAQQLANLRVGDRQDFRLDRPWRGRAALDNGGNRA